MVGYSSLTFAEGFSIVLQARGATAVPDQPDLDPNKVFRRLGGSEGNKREGSAHIRQPLHELGQPDNPDSLGILSPAE